MRRTKARQLKNMLEKRVTELISLAKDLCLEAEVAMSQPRDDEDAVIEVFVPPENHEEVADALTQRSVEILLDDGFFIVTLVYEKKPAPAPWAAEGRRG